MAVGGTRLTLIGNNYLSETGWSGSGGGQSIYQLEPGYQSGVQSSGYRQIPDVAFDADPASGVAVYDSYNGGTATPWFQVGGTSLSAPCWAGLVANADALRLSQGSTPLDGRWQTLPALYGLPAADFHDITSGSNGGFTAGPGYDKVTGRGTPRANLLVPDLAATTIPGLATVYSANLDTDPGWTTSGQWAFGHPTGQGGTSHGNPDPANGLTGSNVYGVNLSGDYSTAVGGPYYLTTAPINCSAYMNTTLQFARWLNSDYQQRVIDTVAVSNDGTNWTNVYTNPTSTAVTDSSWRSVQYDISLVADNQPSVQIRWGYQVKSGALAYSGWNIDDISLLGNPGTALPRVASVTPNVATITDATVGTAAFALTLVFNRAMDTSVSPSITFPGRDLSTTLSVNAAHTGWTNGTTYVRTYHVADAGVTFWDITVQVSGAKDTAGNTQAPTLFPKTFSVVTQNPTPVTLIPATGKTGVQRRPTLMMFFNTISSDTFNNFIRKGTGNVVIKNSADGSVAESIAVTSGQVTIDELHIVAIVPSVTLAASTGYYVQIDAGCLTDSLGNRYAGISDTTTWTFATAALGVDHFDWSPVPNQPLNAAFPVTLTAKDITGATLAAYGGTANLNGLVSPVQTTVGTFTQVTNFPMITWYDQGREQVIYLQSEVGGPGMITGLALYVSQLPWQGLDNWTIRVKHTTLSSYATASLDATGWTTVYHNNVTVASYLWLNFPFSTPFAYNGVDNLMVDFSFNNTAHSMFGFCESTPVPSTREAHAVSNSTNGDPLNWSGTSSPTVFGGKNIPTIRFSTAAPVAVTPGVTGNFTNGVWTGNLAVNQTASAMYLHASDGNGHMGDSNTFNVAASQLVNVYGQVFNDLNANGVKDPGEPGMPGWSVQLDLNNDGSIDQTQTADASGNYIFAGVGPGTHKLSEVPQSGWARAAPRPFLPERTLSPRMPGRTLRARTSATTTSGRRSSAQRRI